MRELFIHSKLVNNCTVAKQALLDARVDDGHDECSRLRVVDTAPNDHS